MPPRSCGKVLPECAVQRWERVRLADQSKQCSHQGQMSASQKRTLDFNIVHQRRSWRATPACENPAACACYGSLSMRRGFAPARSPLADLRVLQTEDGKK